MKAKVLEQHDAVAGSLRFLDGAAGCAPDAVFGKRDRAADELRQPRRNRPQAEAGDGFPLGRPRWLARMTVAP